LGTAFAVLAGVTAGIAPVTSAAGADAAVPLPFAHFADIAVDAVHGHVFISGGSGSDSLLVTDLDGNTVTTIPSEPGATSLALSADGGTLYAALTDGDAISVIDTDTLTETVRDETGSGTYPASLAVAGGRVWFGYGTAGAGGIGSLDVSGAGPDAVVLDQDPAGTWAGAPLLATTPGPSGLLVAGAQGTDAADFAVFDVSSGVAERTASTTLAMTGLAQFAVTADGKDVLIGRFGQNLRTSDYRTSDLAIDPDGGERWFYPTAVGVAPDGTVAVSQSADQLMIYRADSGSPMNWFSGPDFSHFADRGVAWDPDGSRLFAVTVDNASGKPTLRVVKGPEVALTDSFGSLSSDREVKPGEPVSGWFRIVTEGTPFVSTVAHLTRIDPAHPDGVALPDPVYTALSGRAGYYSFSDIPPSEGKFTYRIDYTGDASHQPAGGSLDATVAKGVPAVGLTAPAKSRRAAPLSIPGSLSTGPYATGEVVHVTRTDLAHPMGTALKDAPLSADGTFTIADTPAVGAANTYTVTYPGDSAHKAATGSATVQVSRAATALKVSTNAKTYAYHAQATVTAHLGTTYNNRTVAIYAQRSGSAKKTLVKSGKVDAHGNLVVHYTLTHSTTFTAAFTGDYRYAPATAKVSVGVHAKVTDSLRLYDHSTHIGGHLYRVYLRDAGVAPQFMATVAPVHLGQCVYVTLQRLRSDGQWHTVSTSACDTLGGDAAGSTVVDNLPWKNMPNKARYRIRAHYVHDSSDPGNLNTYGSWQYLTIVPHPS
jgi:sugar lactone lactonase YvrE/phage gp46-like protein